MTISGSTVLTVTRDDIVRNALRNLGVLAQGETPSANETSEASLVLNLIVKYLQTEGLTSFQRSEGVIFPVPGQVSYNIYTGTSDNVCDASGLVSTTTTANAVAGDTSVTVSDATGLASGMYIGLIGDSTTYQWTTIISVSGSTVYLTDALTEDFDSGSTVNAYTRKVTRPLDVPAARRRNSSGIETPLNLLVYGEYFDLPNKNSSGVFTSYAIDPQQDRGIMYVWPAPSDATDQIRFTYYRDLSYFTASSSNPDYPQEWYLALSWLLADELAVQYGVTDQVTLNTIARKATTEKNKLFGADTDQSIFFVPVNRFKQV